MKKVLFVCVHNAARSQMAEAFLNRLGEGLFIAESAGLEPGELNPDIVEVMHEIGYDISQNKTKSVFDFYKEGRRYHYVVKVCDQMNGQKCPIFPATLKVLDWNHEDPAQYKGDKEDRLAQARILRDLIKHNVEEMVDRELLQSTNFKSIKSGPIAYISSIPDQKYILDIEHLSVKDGDILSLGVSESMFDNPRFRLESYTSTAVTNWALMMYGQSMLEIYKMKTFNRIQVTGLLNNFVDYMQFSPSDLGLNFTSCVQNFAYEKGFNVKTQYRSIRSGEKLNLGSWIEFALHSLSEKMPLILIGQSEAHFVYGVETDESKLNLTFDILKDGEVAQINLLEWIEKTNNASLVRINIE